MSQPTTFFGTSWIAPIGVILQTIIMISIIWMPRTRDPNDEYKSKYIKAARAVPMALFFYFGVIFIDTFVNVVIFQEYPVGTWPYEYFSGFLALVLGIEWVFMAALVSPNRKTLITTTVYVVLYIIVVKVWVPATENNWNLLFVIAVMIIAACVHGAMAGTEQLVKRFKKGFAGDAPLWDVHCQFKRIFNVPVNIVLWVLLTIEMLLGFAGYSILSALA